MGKVIKILLHIISAIVLTAIVVPLSLAVLLYIPFVQDFVVGVATEMVSKKIDGRLEIDRIGVRLFNRVVIDGLYLEDNEQDTLIYVEKLSVGLSMMGLIRGDMLLDDVRLENTKFYLKEQEDGTTNFKKILNSLKGEPKEGGKPLDLRFGRIRISNMTFVHTKQEVKTRDYGVNFDDIGIDNFYLDASKVSIGGVGAEVRVGAINSLSLVEKSGFRLDNLTAKRAGVLNGKISLDELMLKTPDSNIEMAYLRLEGESWDVYKDFVDSVRIESKLISSDVSFKTIGYFAPKQRAWHSTISDATLRVEGTVSDMRGEIESVVVNSGTRLKMVFEMRDIIDLKRSRFKLNIESLVTNVSDVEAIVEDLTNSGIESGIVERVKEMGDIELTGYFDGTLTNFGTDINIKSDHGGAELDLHIHPSESGVAQLVGRIDVKELHLGRILNSKSLGILTVSANVDGEMGKEALKLDTKATLHRMDIGGYSYENIVMDGRIENSLFAGRIESADPNIEFDFDGLLDFNGELPKYDFDLRLKNADLKRLHIKPQDSVAMVGCRVIVSASGTSADNLNGTIRIADLRYINQSDTISTGEIRISGENDDRGKYLSLRSLFADAEYRSRTSYVQMLSDLRSVINSYAPTFMGDEGYTPRVVQDRASDVKNYSLLSIEIKQASKITSILVPGLVVARGSKLSFMFNPYVSKLSLTASSDYIEYGDNFISKLAINSSTQGDSISLFIGAEDVYASGLYLPKFSVISSLRDNRAKAAVQFSDTTKKLSALVGITAALGRDEVSGIPQAKIRFSPSSITSGDREWGVFARQITLDSTKISVDNLVIGSVGQSLKVYGVASKSREDTLHIELSKFDLDPISKLTSRAGYRLDGNMSGHADLISAMKGGILYAGISFDSVRVNQVELPSSIFQSRWDFSKEQAGFMLLLPERKDTIMMGYYNPATARYRADIKVKRADLSLLDPLFEGVISGTSGGANIDLSIRGDKQGMDIGGAIKVDNFETKVDFLNVPYKLRRADIVVDKSKMVLSSARIIDPEGNSASLDLSVDFSSLKNINYNITVRPKDMMVLNTRAEHNELFYGKMYVSGGATIKGDKGGVRMDIATTTSGKSEFYLPLSAGGKTGVSQIITFVEKELEKGMDTEDYLVRKQMIIDRKNSVKQRAEASNMSIKMEMNVLPNTELQLLIDPRVGDILKAKGNGSLTLNVNPSTSEFSMYGDYEITEGSYQFTLQDIISKKFTIEQGSKITWTGDPADAILNVSAIYKLKASLATLLDSNDETLRGTTPVECYIVLGDRLSHPDVSFRVSVPSTSPEIQAQVANALGTQESMATQFFFLLAANSFYADGGANIGAASGSATAFGFLSNQLGNWMSTDKFDIGFRYTPKSDQSSDEVNVDFSTQLFSRRLLLEAEGHYDTGNNPGVNHKNSSNVSGDFSVTWLIDPAGNLRAKGFTRTINRFDENQGMQESGLGIYYKEDFNTFKDIVRNFKERFSWGKKKRKRKQEALEKQEALRIEQEEELLKEENKGDGGGEPEVEPENNNKTE